MYRRGVEAVFGVVAGVAVALSCGSPPVADFEGSVEDVAGVRIVTNPAPVLGVIPADSLTPTWRTRVDEGPAFWAEPSGLRLGRDRLFVVDPAAAAIHRVTLGGRVERSLGTRGDGPGELSDLDDVVPLVDGDLLVVDHGGVERWSAEGELEASLFGTGLILDARPWDGDRLFFSTLSSDGGLERRLMDSEGGFHDPPAVPILEPRPYEGEAACRRYSYVAEVFWIVRCYELALSRVAAAGVEVEIETADRPVELSESDLDDARRRYRETLSRSIPPRMAELMAEQELRGLRMAQRFPSIRVDEDTGLLGVLEQTSRPLKESDATLHLFTPSGLYVQAVEFGAHWVDFTMSAGAVFVLEEDPRLGLVSLLRYDLPSHRGEIERLEASVFRRR